MTERDPQPAGVIRLEGVPARIFLESQDHQHDLIRELQLIELGDRFDLATSEVSRELARLIGEILSRYGDVRSVTREQALAALERGDERAVLEVPVRPGMADALRTWLRLLTEADRLCSGGELLMLASRPEVRALRAWYVEQLVAGLEGRPGAGPAPPPTASGR